jgi:hypothetical protein
MLDVTEDMKTLDGFLTAIDGERWSDNSGSELTYLLSKAANFTTFEQSGEALPDNLQMIECGDKLVGVVVLTMSKN